MTATPRRFRGRHYPTVDSAENEGPHQQRGKRLPGSGPEFPDEAFRPLGQLQIRDVTQQEEVHDAQQHHQDQARDHG